MSRLTPSRPKVGAIDCVDSPPYTQFYMGDIDWYKCRFLESSENLRPLVRERFGREPSTSLAREIAACLQQGRLFYEAASSSPLEIKPLQLFYGMVGFSKALVMARRLCSLSTLRPAHGLRDISTANSRIADLRLRIEKTGTFQEFNDVVADLTRLCYIEDWTKRTAALFIPSAKSPQLCNIRLSLREILSRIPRLESLYRMTFNEDALTERIDFQGSKIRVDDRELFSDRKSLEAIVTRWRDKFPFLKKWRLESAQHGYGNSIIYFQNAPNLGINEFSEMYLLDAHGSFLAVLQDDKSVRFPLREDLDPMAGGYTGSTYAISPVGESFLSEFSLHYMSLFLLSSLVRYRPQTWTHAVSRSVIADEPSDDRALSLIERFLELNRTEVPEMIVEALNPHEDFCGD